MILTAASTAMISFEIVPQATTALVVVRVKNISSQSAWLQRGEPMNGLFVQVWDQRKRAEFPLYYPKVTEPVQASIASFKLVEPGKSLMSSFEWGAYFSVTRNRLDTTKVKCWMRIVYDTLPGDAHSQTQNRIRQSKCASIWRKVTLRGSTISLGWNTTK